MAGPTVAVILKSPLTDMHRKAISEQLNVLSRHNNNAEFRINGQPFLLMHGEEYAGQFSELHYEDTIGWRPQDSISFAAMCNQSADHYELGKLALEFCRIHDGLIDFGGELSSSARNLDGNLWELHYEAASGKTCICHIGDDKFMESWLNHKDFRMIK